MTTRSRKRHQNMQPLLRRLPIPAVLEFCKPTEREISALVDKSWNKAEILTQNSYYFKNLQSLPTCPSQTIFSSSIDYRARYFGVLESILSYDSESDEEEDDQLEEFRCNYTMFVVGTFLVKREKSDDEEVDSDSPAVGKRIFQHEATITLSERNKSLCLEFDSDPISVPRHGMLNLSVWIEDRSDKKMFLFFEQQDILSTWHGFDHDGTAYDDFEENTLRGVDLEDIFDGGFWTPPYDIFEGKAPWHDSKYFKIYSDKIQYKFQKPVFPNFGQGIMDDEAAQDLVIDKWYDSQTEHLLVRLKMQFGKKEEECDHDHYHYDYDYNNEKPFTLKDLNTAIRSIDWY